MRARRETVDLIRSYYESVDAGRIDDCMRFLTPDATLRIAHHPEIAGRDAIARVMKSGLRNPLINNITHDVGRAWEEDEGIVIFEVEATYTFADGRIVVVPGVVIGETEDGRFRSQRIAADLSVVYGAA